MKQSEGVMPPFSRSATLHRELVEGFQRLGTVNGGRAAAHLNGDGGSAQDFFARGAVLDERTSMKRDAALSLS